MCSVSCYKGIWEPILLARRWACTWRSINNERSFFFSSWFWQCIIDDDGECWRAVGAVRLLRSVCLLFDTVCSGAKRAICVEGVGVMNER